MARSLESWQSHVVSLMPGWRVGGPTYEAVSFAIAKVFLGLEESIESYFDETFLTPAMAERLDQYGAERGVVRRDGESDSDYRARILNRDVVNKAAIIAAIESAILASYGPSSGIVYNLFELNSYGPFLDLDFADVGTVFTDIGYNMFLIELLNVPVSGRTAFLELLIEKVSFVNAFGVFFDIVATG